MRPSNDLLANCINFRENPDSEALANEPISNTMCFALVLKNFLHKQITTALGIPCETIRSY